MYHPEGSVSEIELEKVPGSKTQDGLCRGSCSGICREVRVSRKRAADEARCGARIIHRKSTSVLVQRHVTEALCQTLR